MKDTSEKTNEPIGEESMKKDKGESFWTWTPTENAPEDLKNLTLTIDDMKQKAQEYSYFRKQMTSNCIFRSMAGGCYVCETPCWRRSK